MEAIRGYCDVTRVGVSLKDVLDGAHKMHMTAAAVRVGEKEVARMPLPAILHWNGNHFVILYKIIHNSTFCLADPSFGKVKVSQELMHTKFFDPNGVGVALLLEPDESFYSQTIPTDNNHNLYKLAHLAKEAICSQKGYFIGSVVLLLLSLGINWTIPLLMQAVVDKGILMKDISLVWRLMVMQLSFFLGYIVSSNISNILLMKANFRLAVKYLSKYLLKLIRLPLLFFDTQLNMELIQRMADQDRIQSFLTFHLIEILFAFANLIVFSVMLCSYSVLSFFVFLFFSAIAFIWVFLFLAKRKVNDYSRFAVDSESRNNIQEMVFGMQEIKVNNAQDLKIGLWTDTQNRSNEIRLQGLYLDYYQVMGGNFINKVKDIIITTIIAVFIIKDQMTLGMISSIGYILGQLTGPLGQIINGVKAAQDALLSFERIDEIEKKKDENHENTIAPPNVVKGIFLQDVSFKYGGHSSPYVLQHVSITIPKGKTTAIVGVSGSGKTTLLKLLLSFYYPQQGKVLLDDTPLCDVNPNLWRGKCGVVLQDGYIFSGTIAENIAIADATPDLNQLKYAARLSCLEPFIESLPLKYHTKVGQNGLNLSGGQKQRLLIARAVYRNPEFLFFDEATNSLDAMNERMIVDNLEPFYQGKTVVIIAHRLSTVKNAHHIIVMDKGQIIEEGTHPELIHKEGAYYTLIKNQLELGK